MYHGVLAQGLTCPIIRKGDNIVPIVVDSVLDAVRTNDGYSICDRAVVGITESVVARSQGNYVTVDDISRDVKSKFGDGATIFIINPIYSRNRFAIILRGIARAAKRVVLVMPEVDEVGNVVRNHPFTNMNYDEYYQGICQNEDAESVIYPDFGSALAHEQIAETDAKILIGQLHYYNEEKAKFKSLCVYTLADILSERCEFGVLGSNKADEECLKLFPNKEQALFLVQEINKELRRVTGKDIIVCVYGDGCFKDPVGGIWEFADPISMPAYTHSEIIESTPNELKVKALADDKFKNLSGQALADAIAQEIKNKNNNLKGSMQSQGTTPRLYRDLLASLMDLTSGSGDRCTPIVLIQNYF